MSARFVPFLLTLTLTVSGPARAQQHPHSAPAVSAPIPAETLRSPDYSDGYRHGSMTGMDMDDDPLLGMLKLDRLETTQARHGGSGTAIDAEAWWGRSLDKLWLKFEGHPGEQLRTEALWAHAIAPFWNTQLGVRHDLGDGPRRSWAAFGIEGLAPWWFETEATIYAGPGGRTAARVEFEYEARFTQRWILQPQVEALWYGREDAQAGVGAGLSELTFGLRLRYELHRQFAPYIGVVRRQSFGASADFARARGEPPGRTELVVGLRMWF